MVIQRLRRPSSLSLSIGCKEAKTAHVNLDLDTEVEPDIVADAGHLPLRPCVFDEVLFTDVIEHLPNFSEGLALREILRVLIPGGRLILTTPNNRIVFTILDPAYWAIQHRHYNVSVIVNLASRTGFQIDEIFTSGGPFSCLNVAWYCLVTYPLKRLLGRELSTPDLLENLDDQDYRVRRVGGYTIFCVCHKPFPFSATLQS